MRILESRIEEGQAADIWRKILSPTALRRRFVLIDEGRTFIRS